MNGLIGYLPQDPRTGDPEETVRDRILNARDLGEHLKAMAKASEDMGSIDQATYDAAMRRYSAAEAKFVAGGGYAAEAEAESIAGNLGIKPHILEQQLKTLSGGQRRRVELARILFSQADTMILSLIHI